MSLENQVNHYSATGSGLAVHNQAPFPFGQHLLAIAGGGPAAISTALAFIQRGYDVRVFERQSECKPIGGAVLLNIPVMAILRSYGMEMQHMGSYTVTSFQNKSGVERVELAFNKEVERCMGIKGWQYGVLRSSVFKKMLDLLPPGVINTDHQFTSYSELPDQEGIEVRFFNGETVTADILIGADGIRSGVSRQAFGDPKLFHAGVRVWLAWCDHIPDIPENYGVISHDWQYQASYFPMLHEGKPGFEWWIVEASWEDKPVPEDPRAYLSNILKDWTQPLPRLLEATNFDTQVYRWEIFNRPSMKKWSTGRVMCIGDAIHPVSPYAAYGLGMAIEDGYFLARALDGVDLRDGAAVNAGFEIFEKQRVGYVNHNMEFARFSGKMFHWLPWPLAKLRDWIFDYTPILGNLLKKDYLKRAEEQTMSMKELHVV
ncbi:FAD/NAD(P)-binding domain-containing protein [Aspergillus steynii IBT 23096]|uniref:FAD/NAD(P)-binding domain-containing protein n=1 Tax=Aspergillus steynii IBT 23096 TaxID=1392250 RepID=A0A2I2FRF7_9EURO|nr:FAD/NAD(P)-binding domain-containing protein [Aspergillus steynii IBT 23096]PLB43212.1 FAD/NAD(P)-binding domain-containing protein [Aspergillus steynii IBT 23096]